MVTVQHLWLLCNVHFVQSTQRTRLQTRPFVRGINNLLKLGVCASRNQVVAHQPLKMTLNGFGPVFCIVRRNQQELQLRTYRCRKQQCGGFCVSVGFSLVINVCNHGEHYETPYIHSFCYLVTCTVSPSFCVEMFKRCFHTNRGKLQIM
jgi:hypothetical protein